MLYNYYASNSGEEEADSAFPLGSSEGDWHLLHRQKEREINLRPPGEHPNIVPVVGQFFDRAPPSNKAPKNGDEGNTGNWEKVDSFPEGFAGRPLTWYLLMPR